MVIGRGPPLCKQYPAHGLSPSFPAVAAATRCTTYRCDHDWHQTFRTFVHQQDFRITCERCDRQHSAVHPESWPARLVRIGKQFVGRLVSPSAAALSGFQTFADGQRLERLARRGTCPVPARARACVGYAEVSSPLDNRRRGGSCHGADGCGGKRSIRRIWRRSPVRLLSLDGGPEALVAAIRIRNEDARIAISVSCPAQKDSTARLGVRGRRAAAEKCPNGRRS